LLHRFNIASELSYRFGLNAEECMQICHQYGCAGVFDLNHAQMCMNE
jgi:hypothetical protein